MLRVASINGPSHRSGPQSRQSLAVPGGWRCRQGCYTLPFSPRERPLFQVPAAGAAGAALECRTSALTRPRLPRSARLLRARLPTIGARQCRQQHSTINVAQHAASSKRSFPPLPNASRWRRGQGGKGAGRSRGCTRVRYACTPRSIGNLFITSDSEKKGFLVFLRLRWQQLVRSDVRAPCVANRVLIG